MRIGARHPRARVGIAATVVLLGVAGAAWASIPDGGGVYTACRLNSVGTVRLIDPSAASSSLLSHCTSLETQISWNQTGPSGLPGRNGTSPTVAQLAAGNAHCPEGGAAITDVTGSTAYVCSSAASQTFSGRLASPNGQYALSVTDAGVQLRGPNGSVTVDAAGARVDGVGVRIDGGFESNGTSANGVTINGFDSNGTNSNGITLNGTVDGNGTNSNGISFNGVGGNGPGSNGVTIGEPAFGGPGCRPAARLDDSVALTGITTGIITSGSSTVCIN